MPPVVPFIPLIATAAGAVLNHNVKPAGTGSQSSSTTPEGQIMNYRSQVWNAARKYADTPLPGADPLTGEATAYDQNATALGRQGMDAIGGNADAMSQFMNPYTKNVLDQMNSRWGDLAANTTNATNDAAIAHGAFGGARSALTQGAALSGLNRDQAMQMAQLQSQGYDNAMQNARFASSQGMGANESLTQMGNYLRNIGIDQNSHEFETLKSALSGLPGGQTTTASSSVPGGSKALGGLMGAMGAIPKLFSGSSGLGAAGQSYLPSGSNYGDVNSITDANTSVPSLGGSK